MSVYAVVCGWRQSGGSANVQVSRVRQGACLLTHLALLAVRQRLVDRLAHVAGLAKVPHHTGPHVDVLASSTKSGGLELKWELG